MGHYDAIVVGARAAGASTAMLLARSGHRVLLIDRAREGTDTLSTHALMRPAVTLLDRWGVVDGIVAAGTRGLGRVVFHYGDTSVTVDTTRRLYAPRRTVLDAALVAAAAASGAQVRFGVEACDVLRDATGRVIGVRTRRAGVHHGHEHARIVIGADGRGSRIARAVRPPVTWRGRSAGATVYGYWSGIDTDGFEWCFQPGCTAGLIPTNDDEVCVFVGVPQMRFARESSGGLHALLHRTLAEAFPTVAARVADGHRRGHLHGFPGMAGWLRRPWGAGWALVGDAGHFTDPSTAHGISAALRDAALLARACADGLAGSTPMPSALAAYERTRDILSAPIIGVTEAVASYSWDLAEVQRRHLELSEAMRHEVDVLCGLSTPDAMVAA